MTNEEITRTFQAVRADARAGNLVRAIDRIVTYLESNPESVAPPTNKKVSQPTQPTPKTSPDK